MACESSVDPLQVTYIEEVVDDKIAFLLDEKAGKWPESLAQTIFELSQECLQEKRKRPIMENVLHRLETIMVRDSPDT